MCRNKNNKLFQGLPGFRGEIGYKGDPGEDGEGIPGDKGEPGEKGEPGKPVPIIRPWEPFHDNKTVLTKGDKGEKGLFGQRGVKGIKGERGSSGLPVSLTRLPITISKHDSHNFVSPKTFRLVLNRFYFICPKTRHFLFITSFSILIH